MLRRAHGLDSVDRTAPPGCAIKTLDGEAAWKIGKLIRLMWLDLAKLDKDVAGIVICVRLFSGHTLFSAVVGPGTSPRNWEMVDRKFNTGKR